MATTSLDVEQYRRRLAGIAYRVLGSMSEAEDAVQEAYLRWHQQSAAEVRVPEAWLTTVVTRICIDRARAIARQRESYPGPWLPEPVSTDSRLAPERRAEIAGDLSIALLVLLQNMSVEERVAFVLRQAFDYSYEELSAILQKKQDACRQLVHRAKHAIQSGRQKNAVTLEQHEQILRRFLTAMEDGDEQAVLALIAPEATWTADGGGKAVGASTRILHGGAVGKIAAGIAVKARGVATCSVILLAGEPAIAWWHQGRLHGVWTVETDGERIAAFRNVLNPDKLTHVSPR